MNTRFFAADNLKALSLSVLVTGLVFGGVAQLADDQYQRVSQYDVKVTITQLAAVSAQTAQVARS